MLLAISSALFFMLRLSGDPVALLLPLDAPPEQREVLRRELGLDAPIYVQYLLYLAGIVRLDFGESILLQQPALGIALDRLPATLQLTAAAVAFSLIVGIPLGSIAALGRRPIARAAAMLVAVLGQSMPSYWSGVLLIFVFAVALRLLPSSGQGGLERLLMPTVTLGLPLTARVVQLVRSGIVREMGTDYVRTARGKGLTERQIVRRHALPNVVIPVIAVLGVDIGQLAGGAVITETIFAWPGVGRQLVQAGFARDYPVVQAIVFLVALQVFLVNRLADLLYRLSDPRVRTGSDT
jgi:peptide/nickel transport system permease protein